jgi:hypothetical protein
MLIQTGIHRDAGCTGAGGGAPTGRRNGRFTTGRYTQEVIGLRQLVAILAREARIVCEEIE